MSVLFGLLISALIDLFSYILSRDAYMLVYVRSPSKTNTAQHINGHTNKGPSVATPEPTPPLRALDVVEDLNNRQDQLCSDYDAKYVFVITASLSVYLVCRKLDAGARFDEIRRTVMDIYQTWSLSSNSDVRFSIFSPCAFTDIFAGKLCDQQRGPGIMAITAFD